MENTGYVIYNTFIKGYFNEDSFTEKLVLATIFTDEGKCRTAIAKCASLYKEVPAYEASNMVIKPVVITVQENN